MLIIFLPQGGIKLFGIEPAQLAEDCETGQKDLEEFLSTLTDKSLNVLLLRRTLSQQLILLESSES